MRAGDRPRHISGPYRWWRAVGVRRGHRGHSRRRTGPAFRRCSACTSARRSSSAASGVTDLYPTVDDLIGLGAALTARGVPTRTSEPGAEAGPFAGPERDDRHGLGLAALLGIPARRNQTHCPMVAGGGQRRRTAVVRRLPAWEGSARGSWGPPSRRRWTRRSDVQREKVRCVVPLEATSDVTL